MMRSSLLAILIATSALEAQDKTVIVLDEPSCAKCTISIKPVAHIGTAEGAGNLSTTPSQVRVDGLGRYWVMQELEMPLVFDANGKFVARVGNKGQGPGEFESPMQAMALPGDSMLVFDGVRTQVISPDFKPGRAIARGTATGGPGVVVNWPVLVIMSRRKYEMTPPILRVDLSTDEMRSLGAFGPTDRGDLDPRSPLSQTIDAANGDHFWSHDGARYRVSSWTFAGEARSAFERKPEWFVNPPDGSKKSFVQPYVRAVSEANDGLVWVFVSTARPDYRSNLPKIQGREIAARSIPYEKLYRTTIEIIDPHAAHVVAHTVVDQYIIAALPNGRVAAYSVDGQDVPHVDILQLTLQR
ncbi:MAG TPA: 6-bladed beta-propeller [Gemmatimonadaceae bacterium]|nr:6-bladed beta-propeller [Gemmatimonadaceae bacterium]